jgi:hypothetical protein
VGLANTGIDELASQYADCGEPTSEALVRRTSFDEDWTVRKEWAYAAFCFDTPDEREGLRGLMRRGPMLHGCFPYEHIQELAQANPDRFLNVRNAMALADFGHARLGSLVLQHGHVRPDMMLDLVIQKTVQVVIEITACSIVRGTYDLPQIEVCATFDGGVESIEIFASVVGHNHDEGVQICEDLRHESIGEHAEVGPVTDQQEGKGNQHVMEQHVRQVASQPELQAGLNERKEYAPVHDGLRQ